MLKGNLKSNFLLVDDILIVEITSTKNAQFSIFSECRSFKEMVGITVAEPIVPIYLDRAALRKLKMQDGKDYQ